MKLNKMNSILTVVIILSFSCSSPVCEQLERNPEALSEQQGLEEEQIYKLIRNLNKVKALEKRSIYPVVLVTKQKPTEGSPVYKIQVAIDNELRLEPVYNFEFQVESEQLSYYDPLQDELILVSEWDKVED